MPIAVDVEIILQWKIEPSFSYRVQCKRQKQYEVQNIASGQESERESQCLIMHRTVEVKNLSLQKEGSSHCGVFLEGVTVTEPFTDCRSHNNEDPVPTQQPRCLVGSRSVSAASDAKCAVLVPHTGQQLALPSVMFWI